MNTFEQQLSVGAWTALRSFTAAALATVVACTGAARACDGTRVEGSRVDVNGLSQAP